MNKLKICNRFWENRIKAPLHETWQCKIGKDESVTSFMDDPLARPKLHKSGKIIP